MEPEHKELEEPKLEWVIVKPEENEPTYLKEMFEPVFYHMGRLIKAEQKIFEKYKAKR